MKWGKRKERTTLQNSPGGSYRASSLLPLSSSSLLSPKEDEGNERLLIHAAAADGQCKQTSPSLLLLPLPLFSDAMGLSSALPFPFYCAVDSDFQLGENKIYVARYIAHSREREAFACRHTVHTKVVCNSAFFSFSFLIPF